MGQFTKLRSNIPLTLISFLIAIGLKAQNVQVSGAATGDGMYTTLADAFTAINGGAQTNKVIMVSISGDITETSTATLNANDWKSLSVSPSGGAYKITGSVATSLIHLNGTTGVTIDGLNAGGNALTIDNMATGTTSTILLNNDCKNIFIQNCTILGASADVNTGTVLFGTSNTGSGNDSIKISNCTIDASSAGNPANGICSIGTGTTAKENSTDSIINSSIANYFNTTLATRGILLGAGNTNWTISGCKFFQGSTRNYTAANTHTAITVSSGDMHTLSNNTIGYASDSGTGTYKMTSTAAVRFIGIDVSGTTLASSIQGNKIIAISLNTTDATTSDYGALCGIRAGSGNFNIGDISPNKIGSNTGTDTLLLNSTNSAALVGINSASTGTVTIKKNEMGGLSSVSSTITTGSYLYGIAVSGVSNALSISGNTIGNNSPNNMRAGTISTTSASSVAYGIIFSTTPITTDISSNTIQNFISYGISSSSVRGISTATATGNTSPISITGNTINNLTTNGTLPNLTSGQSAANGISVSIGTKDLIANNTISNIAIISTEPINSYAVGIAHANATNTIIRNNKIFNIRNASTSVNAASPGVAAGIAIRSATDTISVINNMISLGVNESNNTAIVGIHANNGFTPTPTVENIYHNTVNISGIVTTGALPSFGFYRGDFSATARVPKVNIKNNIFTNNRSGGTGAHFAIANNYGATVDPSGWLANASDYNVLNSNAATIGYWGANKTFDDWKVSSSSDANSYSGYAINYIDPASDLHLNSTIPTIVESRGQTGLGVTTDFDGDARPGPLGSTNGGGLVPDIGADEIDGFIKDIIPPAITYTPLSETCDTATRMLTATIIDSGKVYTTGNFQSKIYYRKNKNAWISSQGMLSSGTASNGAWNFPINSSALGGLAGGDTISYFVITQDLGGNITTNPAAGVIATDVNTVTAYPTSPNEYHIKVTPTLTTVTGGAVCDSGKITLNATASSGTLNWYNVASGGISLSTNNSYTTELLKTTTPFYVDATANGCTTLRKSVLAIVNHSSTSTLPPVSACESYTWKGKTYTISGMYTDSAKNNAGCDSITVLNLTINHATTFTETPVITCDMYTWKGKTYTTSGIYTDTTKNAAGCDSIISLTLTIKHSTIHTDTIHACGLYTWRGHTYTTSGIYKDTIPNNAGCDSLLSLNLSITHVNATVTVLNNVITADSIADTYQWIDCQTNLPIQGEIGKSFTATAPSGTYAVIETKNGCADTSVCKTIIITAIASIDKNKLHVFPNPGTGIYTLSLPDNATVILVNLTGEIIYNEQLPKGNHSLDLIKTANGVYMLHVITNQTNEVLKLIKQE